VTRAARVGWVHYEVLVIRKELKKKIESYLKHRRDKKESRSAGLNSNVDESDTEDPEGSLLDEETKKKLQDQILKDDDDDAYEHYHDTDRATGSEERGSRDEDDDKGDKDD